MKTYFKVEKSKYKLPKEVVNPRNGGNVNCRKYPLRSMKVKESFLSPLSNAYNVRSSIYQFLKNNPTKKFTTRKINENEIRVWRIR